MWEDVYKPGVEADMKTRYGYDVYVQPMGQPVLSTGSITATVTAVSRTSENPERAMMLINLVNTDKELYNLLVFGEEGKHYTKESDTRIKVTSGYSGLAWAIGCQFNAYLVDGQDDDVWEETKRLNGEAKMSHLLGFYFDDTNVKDQIANVGAVEGTFATGGTYGLLPIEEEKEVQAKMTQAKMDAGYQDIMDELQRQLDQWKTQK
ncbi:MAG: ABC transporter substrate-binding protein [Bianqueaceae bacterium]